MTIFCVHCGTPCKVGSPTDKKCGNEDTGTIKRLEDRLISDGC
jgi:hypothetical protein